MTDKEKLDKLVAEIERRKKMNILNENKYEEDIDLLSFYNSMQEDPKDKCKGCNNVKGCITCVDGSEYAHIEECNITGIKSKEATGKLKECIDNITEEGLKEARKQLQELISEDLMSATNNYCLNVRKGYPRVMDETDRYICNAFKAGANWQKEQLLAKAVDGEVTYGKSLAIPSLGYRLDKERLDFGDKVKVIIIKKE